MEVIKLMLDGVSIGSITVEDGVIIDIYKDSNAPENADNAMSSNNLSIGQTITVTDYYTITS